jgi:hypothetical protein
MQYSDLPPRIPVPFAESGPKNTIPVPSQTGITPGAASFTTGFPPLTMTPVAAGGVPPFGQDMNGILFDTTSWARWQGAGGLVEYDATFSTAIGGYPKGAMLKAASGSGVWLSTADNNTTNPDLGGSGWAAVVPRATAAINANTTLTATNAGMVTIAITANSTITLPAANAAGGLPISFTFVRTDTSAFVATVQRAGSDTVEGLTSITIPVGGRVTLVSDGASAWRLAASVGGGGGWMQEFTANGTFVVPAGVTRVFVRAWGGGGAGNSTSNGDYPGGAGGAGGYGEGVYDVTPGASIAVTCGAGGVGAAGGASSFGSHLTAGGGGRGGMGSGSGVGAGGTGGTVSGAHFAVPGAQGGPGIFYAPGISEGGNGPGSFGGQMVRAVGVGGANIAGSTGTFPGGGGSGGSGGSGSGPGAPGRVIVFW